MHKIRTKQSLIQYNKTEKSFRSLGCAINHCLATAGRLPGNMTTRNLTLLKMTSTAIQKLQAYKAAHSFAQPKNRAMAI